jgi:hypothetical protein
VARGAIGVEDLFSGSDISSESWGGKSEGDGTDGGSLYKKENKGSVSKN